MRNVLFIVHCEELFRRFFPDELFMLRLRRSALARKYDRVILLDSGLEEMGDNGHRGIVIEIAHLGLETWCWSWGYSKEIEADVGEEAGDIGWVIDSKGHECTWVPTEIRDDLSYFQNSKIYIAGGCDGECLADWESVLEYLDLRYQRIEGLIYP